MNSKHTAGPWEVSPSSYSTESRYVVDVDGNDVARIKGGELTTDANARLIAAAPEMRDMLADLEQMLDGEEDSVREEHADRIVRLRALLARIDGGE